MGYSPLEEPLRDGLGAFKVDIQLTNMTREEGDCGIKNAGREWVRAIVHDQHVGFKNKGSGVWRLDDLNLFLLLFMTISSRLGGNRGGSL